VSENQNWQEQLQQRAGDLIAQRLGNFAEELQTVQTALNGIRERLQTNSAPVTAEETAGLQECLEQARSTALHEVESGFQARLEQAIEQARDETKAQIRQEYEGKLQDLQTELEAARQANNNVRQEVERAGVTATGSASGRAETQDTGYHSLRLALEEIDAQRQQADVLSVLVSHAASYAPRVVFFVIKSGNAIGWKANGFTHGLSDETVRSLNIPLSSNVVLHEATTSLRTVELNNSATGILGQYDEPVAQALAVPLVIRGKAAAVLYADAGPDGQPINLDALESLMQVTSMAIELLPVRRSQPVAAQPAPQPAPTPQPAPSPVTPAPEPTPAFAYQAPEEAPAVTASVAPTPTTTEVKEAAPAHTASASSTQGDDEVRAHNDARRFARLLVSEIKLYNEQKVMEGRRSHDLYERLKEDIDRSRQMYEKRVSASVAAKFDYFYDELLHTLGEGDPAKLGSGCPGPTVPVN
jgi:hypothetical protein